MFENGCEWLVERPSNNPEPDSAADMITVAPCGAPVTMLVDGWECLAGHEHVTYGSFRQQEMEAIEAREEQYA